MEAALEARHQHVLVSQVLEMEWSMPELLSPPTASGPKWQRGTGSYGDSSSSLSTRHQFPEQFSLALLRCRLANLQSVAENFSDGQKK
jgi:hypothetical protein